MDINEYHGLVKRASFRELLEMEANIDRKRHPVRYQLIAERLDELRGNPDVHTRAAPSPALSPVDQIAVTWPFFSMVLPVLVFGRPLWPWMAVGIGLSAVIGGSMIGLNASLLRSNLRVSLQVLLNLAFGVASIVVFFIFYVGICALLSA